MSRDNEFGPTGTIGAIFALGITMLPLVAVVVMIGAAIKYLLS